MTKVNKTLLNKGEPCRGCVTAKPVLTADQLDELRDFVEELDLIPLSFIPDELRPMMYKYQDMLVKDQVPFDTPLERDIAAELSRRIRVRRYKRQQIQNEGFEFVFEDDSYVP